MAADPNPALRAELNAALAVLAPQIAGLKDLELVSLTEEVKAVIRQEREDRERRVTLINDVLAYLNHAFTALDRLEADGYPAMPLGELPGNLFAELLEQQRDFAAAFSQIVLRDPATTITIDLGTPAEKA